MRHPLSAAAFDGSRTMNRTRARRSMTLRVARHAPALAMKTGLVMVQNPPKAVAVGA
jgi:hypothetical protein